MLEKKSSSNNDLVSIIVPFYNASQYIEQCIENIINQTYENLDIIFINDESTDNTSKIIESYAQKDSRIKILSQKHKGPAAARNLGLKNASGDYICFVDADDYISWDAIETYHLYIKKNNSDLVMSDIIKIDEYNNLLSLSKTYDKNYDIERILDKDDYIGEVIRNSDPIGRPLIGGRLYSKELFSKNDIYFPEHLNSCEDLGVIGKIAISCESITFINRPLYYYRQQNNSLSHSIFNQDKINGYLEAIFMSVEDMKEYFSIDERRQEELLTEFIFMHLSSLYLLSYIYNKKIPNKVHKQIQKLSKDFFTKPTFYHNLDFTNKIKFLSYKISPYIMIKLFAINQKIK